MRPRSPFRRSRGYTLVESLVASGVLMIAVGAASKLSLTLNTQDEMNQRAATALNYLETSARLYQLGVDETTIVPADPVIDSLTITPSTPAVAGLGNMEAATIMATFHSAPATQTWTAHTWTGGDRNSVRTVSVVAYRSALSSTVN